MRRLHSQADDHENIVDNMPMKRYESVESGEFGIIVIGMFFFSFSFLLRRRNTILVCMKLQSSHLKKI